MAAVVQCLRPHHRSVTNPHTAVRLHISSAVYGGLLAIRMARIQQTYSLHEYRSAFAKIFVVELGGIVSEVAAVDDPIVTVVSAEEGSLKSVICFAVIRGVGGRVDTI